MLFAIYHNMHTQSNQARQRASTGHFWQWNLVIQHKMEWYWLWWWTEPGLLKFLA